MGQKGFSLVEVMASSAICLFLMAVAYASFSGTLKEIYTMNSNIGKAGSKAQVRILLDNVCWQTNTFHSAFNELDCLKNGSCTSGKTGDLHIYDDTATLYNKPNVTAFSPELNPCAAATSKCPYTLISTYKVLCGGSTCDFPDIKVSMQYSSTPTGSTTPVIFDHFEQTVSYKPTFSSCADALSKGHTTTDFYLIDPDGVGGICPFQIYCSMSSSTGIAKALIGRASQTGYAKLEDMAPPLGPHDNGVLPANYRAALLQSSDIKRQITVDIEQTAAGSLSLALQLSSGNTQYNGTANISYCEFNNRNFQTTTSGSEALELGSKSGSGFVGFANKEISGEYLGFTCQLCDSTTQLCGIAANTCCQKALRGNLWLE